MTLALRFGDLLEMPGLLLPARALGFVEFASFHLDGREISHCGGVLARRPNGLFILRFGAFEIAGGEIAPGFGNEGGGGRW